MRCLIGVVRYEGDEARDLENFFMAGARLVDKKRTGPTVTRRYDESRTPYRRLREDACLEQNIERSMEKRFLKLNPAALRREREKLRDHVRERRRSAAAPLRA